MSKEEDIPVIVAAVEGGGTSFKVAVVQVLNKKDGAEQDNNNDDSDNKQVLQILQQTQIDSSTDPSTTLTECANFLQQHKPAGGYHALGLATFGPVGLHKGTKEYGCILSSSPKQMWRNVNLLEPLSKACQGGGSSSGCRPLGVLVETDVNAPALAEYLDERRRRLKRDDDSNRIISSLAYVTVGTGVGVGLVINHKTVHGRMHPEGGHVPVIPLEGDQFTGYSWGVERGPFQGKNTVEGLTSSVALTERLEQMQQHAAKNDSSTAVQQRDRLKDLPDNHEVWDHAANALANLCTTLLLLSVEKIVLGGGIMKRKGLLEKVQQRTIQCVNHYLDLPEKMSEIITTSRYEDDAGLMGAIILAKKAYEVSYGLKNNDDDPDDDEHEKTLAQQKLLEKERTTYFYAGVVHGVALVALAAVVFMSHKGFRS